MLSINLKGCPMGSSMKADLYRHAEDLYNSLPLDADMRVDVQKDARSQLYNCIVDFRSSWGRSQVRQSCSSALDASRNSFLATMEEIKKLKRSLI